MPLGDRVSGHREQQALQKSLVKIIAPLVLQRRLLEITTNRICPPEACQFGNKHCVGLKYSIISLLGEWAFASTVIFLYPLWSKSWKILKETVSLWPQNRYEQRATGPCTFISAPLHRAGGDSLQEEMSAWRLLHAPFRHEPLHWDCQWQRMQLAPKELWF